MRVALPLAFATLATCIVHGVRDHDAVSKGSVAIRQSPQKHAGRLLSNRSAQCLLADDELGPLMPPSSTCCRVQALGPSHYTSASDLRRAMAGFPPMLFNDILSVIESLCGLATLGKCVLPIKFDNDTHMYRRWTSEVEVDAWRSDVLGHMEDGSPVPLLAWLVMLLITIGIPSFWMCVAMCCGYGDYVVWLW